MRPCGEAAAWTHIRQRVTLSAITEQELRCSKQPTCDARLDRGYDLGCPSNRIKIKLSTGPRAIQ